MKNGPHFKDKLLNIYNYSKRQISYKRQLIRYLLIFGFNTLFGILIYFLIDLFKTYPDRAPFYLFFLIIVALSVILGGLYSALLTTGIISLEAYFIFRAFYKTNLDLTLYIQLTFFIGGSIIISYLINLIKETNEVTKLKQQEKTYARTFIQLHDEYEIALKNIKARDQFLSIVSHELKTPLTIMLLKLHDMLNSIQNVSLANFSIQQLMNVLKNSEQQIKWLSLMINDLLDVSLITTGRMSMKLEDTDLLSVTKQVKQSFSELLKKGKCKIEIHADSPVIGRWDKGRIEQAITNLVSNAIRYGEGTPIEIKIFKTGNQGKFIIKDEGIGIAQSEQKIIFELFKQASAPGKYKKGLGVGLFITSQIVKIHRGNI
ncbi:MAG: HAMP domain-containing sensor histidine kinase, partial [Candidatus Levybacteria bacterium]|nr:HAMP domain-containing sensor histidine kinase [Candidatus Levybacteria bacterium]